MPQLPHLSYHRIFYAQPGEVWRIAAMLDLYGRPGPWTESREREFGTLLGYEDWQHEIFFGSTQPRARQ